MSNALSFVKPFEQCRTRKMSNILIRPEKAVRQTEQLRTAWMNINEYYNHGLLKIYKYAAVIKCCSLYQIYQGCHLYVIASTLLMFF